MASEILQNNSKTKFHQLELLIIGMAGCTLASLQIIHFVFFSYSTYPPIAQSIFDWLFSMSIIGGLVHFSFREILKIQQELLVKKEQASKAERQMQHIIDNSQDAIFILNEKGSFIFASKSAENLMGYRADELMKLNIENVVSDDYRSYIKKLIGQSLDFSGRHIYIDFKKLDGTLTPVEMSFIPVMDYSTGIYNYQGIARDITERKAVEVAQKEKEHYLQTIAKVGQILVEPNAALPFQDIIRIAGEASQSTTAFINITDTDVLNKLNIERIVEWCAEDYKDSLIEMETISKAVSISEIPAGETMVSGIQENDGNIENNSMASILFPLTLEGKYVGVIGFNRLYDQDSWKAEHVDLLNSCTNMVSQAIEKQIASNQLKTYFISLAKTISNVLFVVDPFTASHQQRLAEMVCLVGERMGLNAKQIEWLYFCGLLHDIGKAAIPGTILSKPGKLTDEEWVLMRSHVKRGYEMLKGMNLPDYAVDMVLHHHERVDGTGYPDGLKGDKLSLESKILGICDVVEAMSSHRPYRPARKVDEIIEELNKGKGTKYDYGLAEMMVDMLQNGDLGSMYRIKQVIA